MDRSGTAKALDCGNYRQIVVAIYDRPSMNKERTRGTLATRSGLISCLPRKHF